VARAISPAAPALLPALGALRMLPIVGMSAVAAGKSACATLLLLLAAVALAQESASLEGQVLNAITGEPVRKAQLTLQFVGQGTPLSATSDAKGKFTLTKVAPGDYVVYVRHPAFDPVKVGIRPDGSRGELIHLEAGEAKTGLTVKLTPYGAIAGRVLDEDGDPIKGMHVAALQWEYTTRGRRLIERRSGNTDDQGDYRVFDIRPGKYVLCVAPERTTIALSPDEKSFAALYYPNSSDARGAIPVALSPGQQIGGVNFTLRRARYATIRGRVIVPDGATDISVELMVHTGETRAGLSSGIRNAEGKFQIYGVPPGSFYITGSYRSGGGRFVVQMPLEVGMKDIDGLELRPLARMTLNAQVRIVGETDHKLSDVHVQFEGEGYWLEQPSVNTEGRLTLRGMEPDIYTIHVNAEDLYLKAMQWGTREIAGELDLTSGIPANTELTITMGADGGALSGTVRNEKQEPVPAMVALIPLDGNRWWCQVVNAEKDGQFKIGAIAPGRYKLWAFDEVNRLAVWYDPDFLAPFQSAAVDIEVHALEKKSQDLKLTVNR
jgi:Carboxypeptidase regulatory-like domain